MTAIWDDFPPKLKDILTSLKREGGQPFLVGGSVRDYIMGITPKDYDVEVFNMEPDRLEKVLQFHGDVNTVGRSFGVMLLSTDAFDVEVSIPRRENKEGQGHKGFIAEPDPTMTIEDAASRRDFTINAIMMNPFTGELLDPFEGTVDLMLGVLRPVSEKFKEDPLRVLRGMQFAGRLNMRPTDGTVLYSNQVLNEYSDLSKERIWGEWEKWALKSAKPSKGIEFLADTHWLAVHYPEIHALKHTLQDPSWHPEGNAFKHVMFCLDHVPYIVKREVLTEEERLVLMFAVLCHDLGKPSTTIVSERSGRIIAPKHDVVGADMAGDFLKGIGAPKWVIEQVVPLVREHMILRNPPNARVVRRLAQRIEPASIRMLAFVIESDESGRPPHPAGRSPQVAELLELAREYRVEMAKPDPLLMGRDLIDLGLKPGPEFGTILKAAYEAQLDGRIETLEEAIDWVIVYYPQIIADHERRQND